jgi:cardiolipin synthase A/B
MDNYCGADSVELIAGGPDYFTCLEKLIDSAKEILHLHTYILDEDETGLMVIESLKKAVARGVKTFVLADGFGSSNLSKKKVEEMRKSGIHFRYFSPSYFTSFKSENPFLGRRLHHKIAVADKKIALIAGINISNKYHGNTKDLPWLDYAVLIKGEICTYLDILCEKVFLKKTFRHINGYSCPSKENNVLVRFRRNDWVRGRSEVYLSYLEALNDSKNNVIIAASYFHPDPSLRIKIKQACKRGVKVKLLLAGLNDVPFSKYGEQYIYASLLKHGVEIYEWPHSVLHCKAIVVDDEFVSIGSYNLNELSHYLCIELNTDIKSKKLNAAFRKDLEQYLVPEYKVDKEIYLHENAMRRVRNFIVYWCFFLTLKMFLPRRA